MEFEDATRPFQLDDMICGCGSVKDMVDMTFKNMKKLHETGDCANWTLMALFFQAQIMASVSANIRIAAQVQPEMTDAAIDVLRAQEASEALNWYRSQSDTCNAILNDIQEHLRTEIDKFLSAARKEHH